MGAPLLRDLELWPLQLWCHLLPWSQSHLQLHLHQWIHRLPFQWLLPLLLRLLSHCRLNHQPPSPLWHPPLSLPLRNLRIPNPRVRGYWVNHLPKRSMFVYDKPIRIKWLTFAQLPVVTPQMLIHFTTRGYLPNTQFDMQEHPTGGPPFMTAPIPNFAAPPLGGRLSQLQESCSEGTSGGLSGVPLLP